MVEWRDGWLEVSPSCAPGGAVALVLASQDFLCGGSEGLPIGSYWDLPRDWCHLTSMKLRTLTLILTCIGHGSRGQGLIRETVRDWREQKGGGV